MYREKYGFTEPPKNLQDAFARVGIQYKVCLAPNHISLPHALLNILCHVFAFAYP